MLQAHEANAIMNVKHVYDKENIGSGLDMKKMKVDYAIVFILYSNLLIQTVGPTL